jgi:hypothetical protein
MSKNERHLRRFGCLTFGVSILVTLLLWAGWGELLASDPKLSIGSVRLDRTVLRSGELATLSFHLSKDARVTIQVYGPNFEVVRKLTDQTPRPAGVNGVSWDGRDDSGEMVPDEAYLVSILAEVPSGEKAVYDPTLFSGGEAFDIPVRRIVEWEGAYRIHYSVPHPSRVTIQAGTRGGPLLKTVLDWKATPAGDHVQGWNGMDETGKIRAIREPGRILYIKGFRLPETAIIVQGSEGDYRSYYRRLKPVSPDKAGILSFQGAKVNALNRAEKGISQQYLVPQSVTGAPNFTVYLGDDRSMGLADRGVVAVSGPISLTVDVSPESLPAFNESRFEIVVFVDHRRFDEEEQAYPSYTYVLDTRQLGNGEHLVTINLASMAGQVGSYSFRINVKN